MVGAPETAALLFLFFGCHPATFLMGASGEEGWYGEIVDEIGRTRW